MNNVILIGRLTSDPTLRFVSGGGQAVANFTIACDKGLSKEKKQEFQNLRPVIVINLLNFNI